MRKFSSYGPVDKDLHFFVPRTELVRNAEAHLRGEVPEKGGHFVTVWAPRQCGKTWIMREVLHAIRKSSSFLAGMVSFQSANQIQSDKDMLAHFVERIGRALSLDLPQIDSWDNLADIFKPPIVDRPVVLILDEFDALPEGFINNFATQFRDIYINRHLDPENPILLHGLALIGVRSVLGIENDFGSPFNVQRSLHIPHLTFDEVQSMFRDYERESGQRVEPAVIERVYEETRGQPGLVSWFGELLTETYNPGMDRPISEEDYEYVLLRAIQALPNNNILNIISKAKREPYRETLITLFRTTKKTEFSFDDPRQNFLYMNGVIDIEDAGDRLFTRFSCPFVQKRLFNYFSRDIFQTVDHLYDPMTDIEAIVGSDYVDIIGLMTLYQDYIRQNRDWLWKGAPRRKTDLRIYEAVFHFNLYMYLESFFQDKGGKVFPEFPTGNGKIDLLIRHGEQRYAMELKSFKDRHAYKQALVRAAEYAAHLDLERIFLILFIESIDDGNRERLEVVFQDEATGAEVVPFFVETGDTAEAWSAPASKDGDRRGST
ncbi:MAG: AAA-like domain-containing protein [Desulfococcaceae bacterium]